MQRALGRRSLVLLAATVLTAGAALPASAAGTIGGDALAGKGSVVQASSCAKSLPKLADAGSYVLADLDSGDVLAARNAHGKFLPASTMKVLTALTLIPNVDPSTLITPSYD